MDEADTEGAVVVIMIAAVVAAVAVDTTIITITTTAAMAVVIKAVIMRVTPPEHQVFLYHPSCQVHSHGLLRHRMVSLLLRQDGSLRLALWRQVDLHRVRQALHHRNSSRRKGQAGWGSPSQGGRPPVMPVVMGMVVRTGIRTVEVEVDTEAAGMATRVVDGTMDTKETTNTTTAHQEMTEVEVVGVGEGTEVEIGRGDTALMTTDKVDHPSCLRRSADELVGDVYPYDTTANMFKSEVLVFAIYSSVAQTRIY